jgi:peptide/nickel transport system permease protein
MRYILVRLAQGLLLLFGVSVLSFALLELAPGDYFQEMRLNPQISPATIAKLRAEYDIDKPMAVRYVHWLAAATHGDFGLSLAYGSPVAPLLVTRARNTSLLTLVATVLPWITALSKGFTFLQSATRVCVRKNKGVNSVWQTPGGGMLAAAFGHAQAAFHPQLESDS